MDNSKEYILCAAIKRTFPRPTVNNSKPYYDGQNDILCIEIGYRHHDILQRFPNEVSKKISDQGFYTSKGRFVDRQEAMKIAFESRQVEPSTAINKISDQEMLLEITENIKIPDFNTFNNLYSEDLY